MKQWVLAVGLLVLLGSQPAEAGLKDSIVKTGIWLWNRIPATIEVLNTGTHFVHDILHNFAEVIKIEVE